MTIRMQQKRDTAANWASNDPILTSGEIGFETDTNKIKLGDGATVWNSLAYIAGGLVTNYLKDDANDTTTGKLTMAGADLGANALTVNAIEVVGVDGEVNAAAIEDKFLRNDGNDTTTGIVTAAGLTVGDAGKITFDVAPASNLTGTGDTVSMTVDANTIGVGSALHLDADGNWIEADADLAATMPCQGIALETGTGTKTVLLKGFLRRDDWDWTIGAILYVSASVGTFTETAPAGAVDQVQVIGIALTADIIYFNPSFVIVQVVA